MTLDFKPMPAGASALLNSMSASPAQKPTLSLQALSPLDPALFAGGGRRAEVLTSLAGSEGGFRVLLRLTAEGARPASEISLLSSQPIPPGTQLQVEPVNVTRLLASLLGPATTATPPLITRLDPGNFPAGTALELQVIARQPAADGKGFMLQVSTPAPAGSGQTQFHLQLRSPLALEPGSRLQALVGQQGELRLSSPGERQRQLQLLDGLRETLPRQVTPEQLLQRVATLQPGSHSSLPAPVVQAISQLLKQVPEVTQLSNAQGVATAIQRSGLFMEQGLQQLVASLGTDGKAPALPQLLAALSQLPGSDPRAAVPGNDLKSSLLHLLLQLQVQLPAEQRALTLPNLAQWQGLQQQARPGLFPLPTRVMQVLGETTDLGSLLRLAAALFSRIQHQQFQSLGQTQSFSDGSSQTVWQMDLPLRDQQQFSHVQLRIQRDDPGEQAKQQRRQLQWEIRLSFNLDSLGSLQAIARLSGGQLNAELWAEQPGTLRLLDSELPVLRERLRAQGLEVGELRCRRGSPPEPHSSVQRHWIDEVT